MSGWRRARMAGAALALACSLVSPLAAAPADASVRLSCQRRPTPGRMLCELELELASGALRWADVLVVEAPGFAPPLRSRVGPNALFMQTERRQRLQLALAATQAGHGVLRVQARAVACSDASGRDCRPLVRQAEAPVAVGPITE